jgi:hypothetical protein
MAVPVEAWNQTAAPRRVREKAAAIVLSCDLWPRLRLREPQELANSVQTAAIDRPSVPSNRIAWVSGQAGRLLASQGFSDAPARRRRPLKKLCSSRNGEDRPASPSMASNRRSARQSAEIDRLRAGWQARAFRRLYRSSGPYCAAATGLFQHPGCRAPAIFSMGSQKQRPRR